MTDRGTEAGPQRPGPSVTLQFHPDWPHAGRTVIASLAATGRYRSQFETGTSNGGLTAHPGGDRWRWESRLFARAYDDAPPAARPVYGSLNHRRRLFGGSPRFGSSHFRLTAATLERTTSCDPVSVADPVALVTADRQELVALADADDRDLLDDYVGEHVHGGVRFARDVEALVLYPCYRGTPVEDDARGLGTP